MTFRKAIRAAFFLLLLPLFAFAQNVPCLYTLELNDANGQEWNGGALEVRINQRSALYTPDGAAQKRFFLRVFDGDTLRLNFLPGTDNSGVAFSLYDPEGALVFTINGPVIPAGEVFRLSAAVCPACPVPPVFGVRINEVRATNATVSWEPSDPAGLYLLEIDSAGFLPGKGRTLETFSNSLRITGLKENTPYDFYLAVRCAASGDTSTFIGPFSFKTRWANDVGVTSIYAPESGCGLGLDSVKVRIGNFGGNPQTLIPFVYAVNGQKINIDMPRDGVFTGVIGMDSIGEATFDRVFNFTLPGEYFLQAWTELKADSVRTNDTSSVLVVHAPTIAGFPYFTDLDRGFTGWYVSEESALSSWGLGLPNGQRLTRAFSGARAWTTALKGKYNDGEFSYLLSPCLDFSSLAQDPVLSFTLQADLETCCDGAWVEWSVDGGETWNLLGRNGAGINWYNNAERQVWSGNGGADGWFVAAHPLTGLAGKKDVRLRFALRADFSNSFEGVALDNIRIALPDRDLAAVQVRNTSGATCGNVNDQVTLSVGNLGSASASGFQLAYQVNNGAIVRETPAGFTLAPGQKRDYAFNTRFNSLNPGSYTIKAWVEGNDGVVTNDTIFYTFFSALPMPFAEDFERGTVPQGWTADADIVVSRSRNAASFVVSDNLFANDRTMQVATPAFGAIARGDSLTFEYRYTDLIGDGTRPTTLSANDRLDVQVSTDCGSTYTTVYTINSQNHTPSANMQRVSVKLDAFAGRFIRVRLVATWGQGDYFVDLDNIQVLRCPPSLNLSIVVSPPSPQPRSAAVLSGTNNGPFTYAWNTGAKTASITLPSDGIFEVTVTDRFGCVDSVTTLVTSTREILPVTALTIAPNPTSGTATLEVRLAEPMDLLLQIFSPFGQALQNIRFQRTDHLFREIDLSAYPPGIYFLRLSAGDKIRTEKLLLLGN